MVEAPEVDADYIPSPNHRHQVEAMAGYGVPAADIAHVLDIDAETLRRHYTRELTDGHIKANTKVAENLYRKATGEGREAVTAAIFWLKTRAGWKEVSVHEVSGPEGGPIETSDGSARERREAMIERIRLRLPQATTAGIVDEPST